jgi:hypothetical protein
MNPGHIQKLNISSTASMDLAENPPKVRQTFCIKLQKFDHGWCFDRLLSASEILIRRKMRESSNVAASLAQRLTILSKQKRRKIEKKKRKIEN